MDNDEQRDYEEEAYNAELLRGDLAFKPHAMPCFACTYDKVGPTLRVDLPDDCYIQREVVRTTTSRGFDPSECYHLTCGHVVL